MRILICGDRNWNDVDFIFKQLKTMPSDTIVIEGEARGADKQSAIAAELCGMKIERYPAKWSEYGRAAGPIRNKEMLNAKPNIVWAFHDDLENSKGTANMMAQATTAGISTIHFAHTLSAT